MIASTRFDSLTALQAAHADLVRDVGREILVGANPDRIADFVRRAVATGAVLDAKDDRSAAQSLIGYWTARVVTAGRADRNASPSQSALARPVPVFEDTLLAEYDPATVGDLVSRADAALKDMSEDERKRTRQILLRLVRLRSESRTDGPAVSVGYDSAAVARLRETEREFDPVTALRDDFSRFGSRDEVNTVLTRLSDAGVLRMTPGDVASADQFTLRSAALMTDWPAFRSWMTERRDFRDRATRWVVLGPKTPRTKATGPVTGALLWFGSLVDGLWTSVRRFVPGRVLRMADSGDLLAGSDLDDARKFHDRSEVERTYLDACRNREIVNFDRNRVLMGLFGISALVAVFGWIGVGVKWGQARENLREAELAKDEATRNKHVADERLKLSSLRVLIRGYGDLAAAESPQEYRIAIRRWDSIVEQGPLKSALGPVVHTMPDFFSQNDQKNRAEKEPERKPYSGPTDPRAAIAIVSPVRDELVNDPNTREAMAAVRKTAFDVVRACSREIVDAAVLNRPYADVAPFAVEFVRQFWGEMLLVESETILKALEAFKSTLGEYKRVRIPNPDIKNKLTDAFNQLNTALGKESDVNQPLPGERR